MGNGQVRADAEVVSATLELKNGRFPPRKNSPPSIPRDTILTIDDFELANEEIEETDKKSSEATTHKLSAKEKGSKEETKEDPVITEGEDNLTSSEGTESLTTTTTTTTRSTTKRPRPKRQGNRKRNKQRKKQNKRKKKKAK